MSQHPPTVHPLAARYLDELGRLLHRIDPVERYEVLDGVREHLDASLEGTSRSDKDVRAALDELGSPQTVADEAYAGRGQQPPPWPDSTTPTRGLVPSTSRPWLPAVVVALEAFSLLLLTVIVSTVSLVTTTLAGSTSGGPDGVSQTVTGSSYEGGVGGSVLGMLVASPFWLAALVLVAVTALWTGREKLLLVALVPTAAVLFSLLPAAGYWLFDVNGVFVGAWVALALTFLGGGTLLVVLFRRGQRRARAVVAPI